MSNKLSKQVLETLQEKNIVPKPRWQFLLHDWVVWAGGIVTLLVGSLAVSVILFMIKTEDWDLYQYVSDSLLEFVLASLPYFWIIVFALFVALADYYFKHTKRGYRYRLIPVIIGSIVLSSLIGLLLFQAGLGQRINQVFVDRVPFYSEFVYKKQQEWVQPDMGRLAGEIISVDEASFVLRDFMGNAWAVTYVAGTLPRTPTPGTRVKMGGTVTAAGEFVAEKVRLWPDEQTIQQRIDEQLQKRK